MSEPSKVAPALSPDEWADKIALRGGTRLDLADSGILFADNQAEYDSLCGIEPAALPALIAIANAALRDDDPRKITWAWVDELRGVAEDYKYRGLDPNPFDTLNRMADALASLLPPRP